MEGAACGYATHALHSPAMQGSGCCLRIRDARAAQCAKRCRSRIPKCSPECSEDSRAGQDLDYLVMETPMPSEMQTPRPTTSTILARRKASAKYRERQLSSSTNEELLRKKARERMASGHLRRRAAVKKDQTLAEESRRRVQEYNKKYRQQWVAFSSARGSLLNNAFVERFGEAAAAARRRSLHEHEEETQETHMRHWRQEVRERAIHEADRVCEAAESLTALASSQSV
ncbi:hypothetical protein GGX14DRAFT_399135 [Mycena pura]|uniref:Uncharacterized protein n=1 Tax=Mycena pura TaxID=153505 RepID=A0AAD6V8L1_9AGAR|nr:hypothetical protein GGX14DRAFT_399135 [Mycena pura]